MWLTQGAGNRYPEVESAQETFQKQDVPDDQASVESAPGAEPPGVVPARGDLQPVTDFDTFLQSLPDFGPDAARLRESIAEERALRRAATEAGEC
jgi:hypothetical protein